MADLTNIKNTLLSKTEDLLKEPQGTVNFIDLDYKLLEDPDDPYTTSTRKMVEKNYEAILNPYRMWLQSDRGDYIREADAGGMFQFALNDKFKFAVSEETAVSDYILSESKARFPELAFVSCKAKCIMADRKWDIEVVVQDKYTGNLMGVKSSVDGMVKETLQ